MDTKTPEYFTYSDEHIDYLKSKDPVLGGFIAKTGRIQRKVIPDLFSALINSIIGQQISTKAQTTIWQRFNDELSPVTSEHFSKLSVEEIQKMGVSMRKAGYIKDISDVVHSGALDLNSLHALSDSEVCDRLCELKGIGVWTAEMLMLFSMQRMNIFSYNDLAIRRGLCNLHGLKEITPELFEKYRKLYDPYCSVASLYIWAAS